MFRAILFVTLLGKSLGCFEPGIDYAGYDLKQGHLISTPNPNACQVKCQQTSGCKFWTWDPGFHNACWMKYGKGAKKHNARLTSGPRTCGGSPNPAPNPTGSCFEKGIDYYGGDLGHFVSTPSATACQTKCQQTQGCNFWTWDPGYHNACWRKSSKGLYSI